MYASVTLPVTVRTRVEKDGGAVFYIPEIIGHWNPYVERKVNWHMYEAIRKLSERQYEAQETDRFSEMIATYEIKTNERNIFSVTFTNYAYADGFAHGLTLMDSLTFNVETGKEYRFKDLFQPRVDYVSRLTELVRAQVEAREVPVFPETPVVVDKNQAFYIADQTLVLYYQLYEITPYYYGIPTFPIPAYQLENLLDEDGPLGRMLPT